VRVVAHFGFMEKANILEILRSAEARGVRYEPERTTYFLSREELLPGQRSDLPPLRRRAFMLMARGAQVIADYYGLPPGRVIEIGTRLEI
jgi:KUP system potassium uptake protein